MKKNNKFDKIFILVIAVLLLIILIQIIILSTKSNNSDNNNPNTPIQKPDKNPDKEPDKPNEEIKYSLTLKGKKEEIIFLNSKYQDSGYLAVDNLNNDYSKEVNITGTVDTSKIGSYKLTYEFKNIKQERIIYVINKTMSYPYIELLGDKELTLKESESFKEPGFLAVDDLDGNLTNKVKTKQEGSATDYTITYSVTNSMGSFYQVTRHIKKIKEQITLTLDKTEYTNDVVNIKINVNQLDFMYLRLPNGVIVNNKNYTYSVTSNGTYEFISYDKNSNIIKSNITVSNIDKDKPTGSCTVTVKDETSTFKINASDKTSGIKNYVYNNYSYINNTIIVNSRLNSAAITIYDKAGNYNVISCKMNIIEEPMDGFILIGDSRFVGMKNYVGKNIPSNVTIISKGSMGINWFIDTAIPRVNEILNKNPNKRYYIFCNLGRNDLHHFDKANYGERLSNLAKTTWKNHKVGFISVNPDADGNISSGYNKKIISFNQKQKNALNGVYYCDTFNGIGFKNFKGFKNDSVHYNKATSINIFNYIINNCKF